MVVYLAGVRKTNPPPAVSTVGREAAFGRLLLFVVECVFFLDFHVRLGYIVTYETYKQW